MWEYLTIQQDSLRKLLSKQPHINHMAGRSKEATIKAINDILEKMMDDVFSGVTKKLDTDSFNAYRKHADRLSREGSYATKQSAYASEQANKSADVQENKKGRQDRVLCGRLVCNFGSLYRKIRYGILFGRDVAKCVCSANRARPTATKRQVFAHQEASI